MSRNMARVVPLLGSLCLCLFAEPVQAQWFSSPNPCACAQPVVQPCYQTVPVTEYQQVRQTVQRPVMTVEYVDQPVTTYEPVTETRTAQIPTVSYQTVTECQACTRNCGYWQTNYQCNPKISPCAYDPRPGLLGWMNRTGYTIRQAFTPNIIAQRQYVPNYVTTMVPVTRQVAVPGVQQVSYNVTRMVAKQTTQKVAYNRLSYVNEEVVVNRPVTVMRTVPIGSSIAFLPFGTTATALAPRPDPASAQGSGPTRSADKNNSPYEGDRRKKSDDAIDSFGKDPGQTEIIIPRRKPDHLSNVTPARRPFAVPTAVRAAQWTPRSEQRASHNGPTLTSRRGFSVADVSQR